MCAGLARRTCRHAVTTVSGYDPRMSEILAAGGVLWRPAVHAERRDIAVIHRPRHDDWSLPKGKLDPGESLVDAAVREVAEETGHRVVVGAALGVITYLKANHRGRYEEKAVHFWALQDAGGRFEPGDEVDELEWLRPAQARRRLSYDMDREVLRRFEWALASV